MLRAARSDAGATEAEADRTACDAEAKARAAEIEADHAAQLEQRDILEQQSRRVGKQREHERRRLEQKRLKTTQVELTHAQARAFRAQGSAVPLSLRAQRADSAADAAHTRVLVVED